MKDKTDIQHCRLCGVKTKVGFNIDFKLIPVCESCATSIFIQQATWYAKNSKAVKK